MKKKSSIEKAIFPQKLWRLVNDSQLSHAIGWSTDGTSFFVYEQTLKVLCLGKENRLFYTRQPKSFVRQLHLYGFRKINKNQFTHPFFRKDHPELLVNIKRSYGKSIQVGPVAGKRTAQVENNQFDDHFHANQSMALQTTTSSSDTNKLREININNQQPMMNTNGVVGNLMDNNQPPPSNGQAYPQALQSVRTEIIPVPTDWYENSYTDISFNYCDESILTMYNDDIYPNTYDYNNITL